MKINGSFEQGIFVVVILALEKNHAPVKSRVMSDVLQVSDSYLKKILMKLSKNGLVVSSASKQGGYRLAMKADEISLKDIFVALELHEGAFESFHYARTIFSDKAHVIESEKKIEAAIAHGLARFYDALDELKVSDILKDGAWQNGAVEWDRAFPPGKQAGNGQTFRAFPRDGSQQHRPLPRRAIKRP